MLPASKKTVGFSHLNAIFSTGVGDFQLWAYSTFESSLMPVNHSSRKLSMTAITQAKAIPLNEK